MHRKVILPLQLVECGQTCPETKNIVHVKGSEIFFTILYQRNPWVQEKCFLVVDSQNYFDFAPPNFKVAFPFTILNSSIILANKRYI